MMAEQTPRERAVDDLWDVLSACKLFVQLVDELEPLPPVTSIIRGPHRVAQAPRAHRPPHSMMLEKATRHGGS